MVFRQQFAFFALPGILLAGLHGAEVHAPPPFSARLLPTIQYAHGDIYHRTPSGQGLPFVTTREIVSGQRLDLVVMAHGAAMDQTGKADVVFDLVVRAPGGNISNERKELRVAVGRSARPEQLLFPTDIVTFVVREGEPVGTYRFVVTVRDRVSGRSTSATEEVVVRADNGPRPWPADTDVIAWQTAYYTRPEPGLFLPSLIELSRLQAVRDRPPHMQGPLLGFGDQILKDNPWLVPQLEAHLRATADEWEKRIISTVLAYSRRDRPERLPGNARNLLERFPVEADEPLAGAQLDLLWGRFLAGGAFDPIDRLVQVVVRYSPYRSAYEAYEARGERRGAPTDDERKGLIRATALWSLGSNARQHRRIHNYLTTLGDAPATEEAVRTVVAEVLADPAPPRPGRPRR